MSNKPTDGWAGLKVPGTTADMEPRPNPRETEGQQSDINPADRPETLFESIATLAGKVRGITNRLQRVEQILAEIVERVDLQTVPADGLFAPADTNFVTEPPKKW